MSKFHSKIVDHVSGLIAGEFYDALLQDCGVWPVSTVGLQAAWSVRQLASNLSGDVTEA